MISNESASLEEQLRAYRNKEAHEVRMTWKQACERMLAEDLGLRRSRARIEDLERQRRNQWREWLPTPSLYISLQSRLREMSDLDEDDISASLYAPITIPNPWSERAKAYRYALAELQAEDSLEVVQRRQTANLYQIFHEWRSLDQERTHVVDQANSVEEEIMQSIRQRESEAANEEKRVTLQLRMSRLMNLPGVRVVPITSSMPDIDYSKKRKRMVPGKNCGKLAMRLSSYQMVSALLRAKGIQVLNWRPPRLSMSLPPVYELNSGEGEFFEESDNVNLFGSWNKSFDVTGSTAATIENAEQQVQFVRESLRLQIEADHHKWLRHNRRYDDIMTKSEILKGRIQRIHRSGNGDVMADLERLRQLTSELRQLERFKLTLDLELWSWDDDAWK